MAKDFENLSEGLEVKKKGSKFKWNEKEKQFLVEYALDPYVGNAMRKAGLNQNRSGKDYDESQLIKRGNDLLDYPEAKEYIKMIQKEIFDRNVHTFEKAVNHTWQDYLEWRDVSKHEANITMERYCKLMGFLGQPGVNFQTQIVTDNDKNITINFITPEEFKNNKNNPGKDGV